MRRNLLRTKYPSYHPTLTPIESLTSFLYSWRLILLNTSHTVPVLEARFAFGALLLHFYKGNSKLTRPSHWMISPLLLAWPALLTHWHGLFVMRATGSLSQLLSITAFILISPLEVTLRWSKLLGMVFRGFRASMMCFVLSLTGSHLRPRSVSQSRMVLNRARFWFRSKNGTRVLTRDSLKGVLIQDNPVHITHWDGAMYDWNLCPGKNGGCWLLLLATGNT